MSGQLAWTTEPPSVPGLYLMDNRDGTPVCIERRADGVFFYHDSLGPRPTTITVNKVPPQAMWLGPLPEVPE